jgi:hypothetical protein
MLEHDGSFLGRMSRRDLIRIAGATGLGLALTQAKAIGGMQEAAAQSESVSTIINIAATAEALAVSLLGVAIQGASGYTGPNGTRGLPSTIVAILKAAQSAEQAHYAFLTKAGARALTLTFNVANPKIATDSTTLYQTIETLETAFQAAYMTAGREFAEMRKPDLVKVAFQIGGVECEHRALARLALGAALPHNLAFETRMFTQVGHAATALERLGFIGGKGTPIHYQDFEATVDNTGMSHLTPM